MRRWTPFLVLGFAALLSRIPAGSQTASAPAEDPAQASLRSAAADLFGSLTDEQKQKALHPFTSPHREQVLFPGGARPGVQIKDLNDDQRKKLDLFLGAFLSEYGLKKAMAVVAQDKEAVSGLAKYYVNFFGAPSADAPWAVRIAEHHLTLVFVGAVPGQPLRIGPLLLGANPPDLWHEIEDAGIAAYAVVKEQKAAGALLEGKNPAAGPMGDGVGVKIADLPEAARPAVRGLLDEWLKILSPGVQAHVRKIVDAQGGVDALRFAFWGEGTARCEAGGKFDWKLEGPGFLCDFENTRGHVHLSLKGEAAPK